jgi:uncharacterized protein
MATGPQPQDFSPQSYLTFDPQEGAVRLSAGERMLIVPEGLVLWIQHALEEVLKGPGGHVLYRAGRLLGHAYGGMFERQLRRGGSPTGLKELPLDRFMELFDRAIGTLGWGRFVLVPEEETLFVDLYGSALVHGLGDQIGLPSCHLYAGFLAGFFGFAGGKRLASSEVQCRAKGDPVCRFLLVPQEDIDAEAFWRDDGIQMKAVLKKLKVRREGNG